MEFIIATINEYANDPLTNPDYLQHAHGKTTLIGQIMPRNFLLFLFAACHLFILGTGHAAPLQPDKVPEPLKPWVDWVLYDHEERVCPMVHNDAKRRFCTWPARLTLELSSESGRFTQDWQIARESWIPLPGGTGGIWPEAVQVDGKPAVVTARNGKPGVQTGTGTHRITGTLAWKELPEFLSVAPASGLVDLTLNGKPVPFPNLDEQGRLWLHAQRVDTRTEDHLEVTVHRLIKDGVPVVLETRIGLRIAGKNREIFLTPPLAEMIPLRLVSPLPARLEPDGRVRLQARPGNWELVLEQRRTSPVAALELPKQIVSPWPEEELWAFQANHALRMVTLSGAETVDPQQTLLPEAWRRMPTFVLRAGNRLLFTEKKRGNPDPDPDRLELNRTLWLDFSGQGFSIRDRLYGITSRAWRLEMNPPQELGRVEVNGRGLLITRLPGATRSGTEIRHGRVELIAESRLAQTRGFLPAVGWEQDFQSLATTLHLPPGWRLFHALGADRVDDTWVSRWTLLDLFLTLILALAARKLWGNFWGLVTLLTLGLVYHEESNLAWPLLSLMATVALLRHVPPVHVLRRFIRFWRYASLLILVLVALPFLITQAQQGIHPQLDLPGGTGSALQPVATPVGSMANQAAETNLDYDVEQESREGMAPPAMEKKAVKAAQASKSKAESMRSNRPDGGAALADKPASAPARPAKSLALHDPNAQIQTGHGLPQWQWRTITLRWNGPVLRQQQLRLYLIPPRINQILNFSSIFLLLALLWRVMEVKWPGARPGGFPGRKQAAEAATASVVLLALLGTGLAGFASSARADLVAPDMLQTLATRLTAPPTCLPACADLPRLNLEVAPDQLRLLLEVHADRSVAVPLPGHAKQWLPTRVLLNGEPATHLQRDEQGTLWILVPQGVHQVLLEGATPAQEVIQIPFVLQPHRVTLTRVTGWKVDGLHDNGAVNSSLQLRRIHARTDTDFQAMPESLPAFVQVERHLVLDLQWRVETRIKRLTQAGTALLLEIPLLPGESVTTAQVRVTEGKVQAHLNPQQTEFSWSSVLEITPSLTLKAPETSQWVEIWHLDVGHIWHLTHAGIPVIRYQDQAGRRQPEWRPWPGEQVVIQVQRPEGVTGPTLTLEKCDLSATPGMQATDVVLTLHLRSSRGGQHAIRLPQGAELVATRIQDWEEPVRQDGRTVLLPITPGSQEIRLSWRQPGGIGLFHTTPQVDLGLPGVNATIHVHLIPGRWLFWVSGPTLGPAILYWGALFIILLLAPALGRLAWTPLQTRHWILLGLGISTLPLEMPLVLLAWFLLLGWRRQTATSVTHWRFNLRQLFLVGWSIAAIGALFDIVTYGLLSGVPDMKIMGNLSTHDHLQWFQDRIGPELPQGHLVSISLFSYRLAMLLWAIWLASATLGWIRWGWTCFSHEGLWQTWRTPKKNV
ncbi:MAG: hypothetical protein HQL65_11230 [Magnetococcales bacterium]|nr:hypothetical protein [Magnetococcales bacterium]